MRETVKLGMDLGNGKLKVCAVVNNNFKFACTDSIYTLETDLGNNIVSIEGEMPIALGRGEHTLINIDKTSREHIKHQILWSVYKTYGEGVHDVSLVTGLPLELYKNKEKRSDYLEQLKALEVIKGEVDGDLVEVHMQNVKVAAEGHAALRVLTKHLDRNYQNLILDVGEGTTDGVLVEYVDGKISLQNYKSINTGVQDIFKVLQKEIVKSTGLAVAPTILEIDRAFKRENASIRGLKGEVNLYECLQRENVITVITKLLDEVQNIFSELPRLTLILIGGGAHFIEKALENHPARSKYLSTVVMVDDETRWFANSMGYACQA